MRNRRTDFTKAIKNPKKALIAPVVRTPLKKRFYMSF